MNTRYLSIHKSLLILAAIFFSMLSYGQSKKVWLQYADDFFKKGDYITALKYYERIYSDSSINESGVLPYEVGTTSQKLKDKKPKNDSVVKVPFKDYIDHQIAVCHQKTYDYKRAAEHFKETANSSYYPADRYEYADALMKMREYDQAIQNFKAYAESPNHTDSLAILAAQRIVACKYALDDEHYEKEIIVEMADTNIFNKGTASFGVMFFGSEDRIMFASAREDGVILDPNKQDSRYLMDLYWTQRDDVDDPWETAKNFGRPLNGAVNDASGTYNGNNVIIYNRWENENPNGVSMYLGRMLDFKFFESYKLDSVINYPGSQNINPYVTEDGKWLYFSSNRPGGKGGFDIWRIKIDATGLPSGTPENLGYPVNTEFDEKTPFYHSIGNILYFSSTGHNSIGGLDIFQSKFNLDDSTFMAPTNMGEPINSSQDDAYLIWDKNMKHGFFSSDREPCEAGHCYDIYTIENAPIRIYIEGYVYDMATNEIIPGASLTFKDVRGTIPDFTLTSDAKGFYHTELIQQSEIFIVAKKKDYFADATNIDTRNITKSTTLKHDFYLEQIPQDEIKIEGIEYDFDSANLRPKSKEVLDKLYEFIKLNDNLTIQINSHTDCRGSDTYNQKLSQRRAQSCVDYLVKEKGIEKERLIAIGYGESRPAYRTDENGRVVLDESGNKIPLTEAYINSIPSKDEQEELHQRNRRTAFEVINQK
ncbi:MAG: OmpA family protein [Brumimicrobium sp.]|nr:OmpA family protein [Brumimicrobium sp.]MCO5269661.1 OmpA family protein [Brumimicrobium sp.]